MIVHGSVVMGRPRIHLTEIELNLYVGSIRSFLGPVDDDGLVEALFNNSNNNM